METAKEPFDLTMIVVQAVTEDEKQLKRQLKTGRAGPDAARNLLRTKIGEFDATIAHDRDAAKTIRGIAAPADLNSIEKLHFSQCIKDVAEQLETRSKVNSLLRDYAKTGDRRLYNGYLDASRNLNKMEESTRKAQVCELCWHETGQPCSPWEELGK